MDDILKELKEWRDQLVKDAPHRRGERPCAKVLELKCLSFGLKL